MGEHLKNGTFQSDKYPTCPAGKVPLSVKDPMAQDLLWEYAQRRRAVDAEFADDLEAALALAGYKPGASEVVSAEIIKAHVGIDAVGWEVGVDFGAAGMSGGTGHANQWTSWPAILLTDGKKLVEAHFAVYGHKNNAGRLLTSTMGENPPNIEQACKLLSDRINEARKDRRSSGDRDEETTTDTRVEQSQAAKTVPHRSGHYIRTRGGFFIYFCAGCGADLINVGHLSRPTWQAVDADNSHIENGTACDPVPDGTLPLPARDGLLYVAALRKHMPDLEAEIANIERRMTPAQKAIVSVLPESLNLRGP
jgi:hypothetical protein